MVRRYWNYRESLWLDHLWRDGYSQVVISKVLQRSASSVSKRITTMRLRGVGRAQSPCVMRPRAKWTPEQDTALRLAWVIHRKTSGQIALRMKRTRNAVMGRIRDLGLLRKYAARQPYDPAAKYRDAPQVAREAAYGVAA